MSGEESDQEIDAAFAGIADEAPEGTEPQPDAIVAEPAEPLGKALGDAPSESAQPADESIQAERMEGVELSDEVHAEELGWLQEADTSDGLTADDGPDAAPLEDAQDAEASGSGEHGD